MRKPYSTKIGKPVPTEFEAKFVEGGWGKVSLIFGKNPALRYYHALGGERLSLMRAAHVRKRRLVAAKSHSVEA